MEGELNNLVLSIFPGIDLLGRAFEEEGFCVVRGPDLLWGGDIRDFHPPAGVFGGVIGGPPCQEFSVLRHLGHYKSKHGNMIPEFERCVEDAQPDWFLMENVKEAPEPQIQGYKLSVLYLNNRWVGEEQDRLRKFCFGTANGRSIFPDIALFENPVKTSTVIASSGGKLRPSQSRGLPVAEVCRLQGLPEGFADNMPFTKQGKQLILGNAVPMPMGRAIARAVRKAMG